MYAELNFVRHTATGGKQDHVVLQTTSEYSFDEIKGQIGITVGAKKPKKIPHPIMEWDEVIQKYLEKGYYLVPGVTSPPKKKSVTKDVGTTKEPSIGAQELIDLLCALANHSSEETFSFQVTDLTKEQISQAKDIFKKLSSEYEKMSIADFNDILCNYFSIIPRRMRKPNDHMAKGRDKNGQKLSIEKENEEKGLIIQKELDTFTMILDLLKGEELSKNNKSYSNEYGLEIERVNEEEEKYIKRHLGGQSSRYLRAWKIKNKKQEEDFNNYCKKNDLTDDNGGIAHLWHGSRGENFLSILISGLKCNPTNALTGKTPIICGKAYGLGIYFAKDAIKSCGYTDRRGSRWANGSANVGYLMLNKVAVGKRETQYLGDKGCDSSLNWSKLQKIKPGAHCTWAECRYSGFMMDEIIVYNDNQSAPEYLIEISA